MKRIIFVFLCLLSLNGRAQFSGAGTGTEKDPYQVTTPDELFEMRNDLSAHYKLMNDVDLSKWLTDNMPTTGWAPIGTATTPFSGSFDGNNHSISGLYINRPSVTHVGLFGYVSYAMIHHVALLNPNIIGGQYTGVLCATSANNGSISNCVIIGGSIESAATKAYVGGIVAYFSTPSSTTNNNTISGSYSSTNITAKDASSFVGGISGECAYANDNVYAGMIKGSGSAAGITKTTFYDPTITRNICTADIYADATDAIAGGIATAYYDRRSFMRNVKNNVNCSNIISSGSSNCNRIVSYLYNYEEPYDQHQNNYAYYATKVYREGKEVSVEDDHLNGVSYGLKILKRRTTYEGLGFDFNNQWAIVEGETFPYNINQTAPATITSFFAGSKSVIEGTAPVSSGKVYIFVGTNMYEASILDGKWSCALGYVAEGLKASVSIKSDDKMPSITVSAVAEKAPNTDPELNPGDANADGVVDVSDVVGVINYIIGKSSATFNEKNADVNEDGQILIDDAVSTVNVIMNQQ